jgi:hypothetical protein
VPAWIEGPNPDDVPSLPLQPPSRNAQPHINTNTTKTQKQNAYDLAAGEASVFDRELKGRSDPTAFRDVKRKFLTAGRDYSHDDYWSVRTCDPDGGVGWGYRGGRF